MRLFGGRREVGAHDTRARTYVLTGEPVVTADSFVVLVDLVVRYDQVIEPDGPGLEWEPGDEVAIDAVAVTTLRVEGEKLDRAEVLGERARLADPVGRALSYAPVGAGFRSSVVSLQVRAHEPDASRSREFRVVG